MPNPVSQIAKLPEAVHARHTNWYIAIEIDAEWTNFTDDFQDKDKTVPIKLTAFSARHSIHRVLSCKNHYPPHKCEMFLLTRAVLIFTLWNGVSSADTEDRENNMMETTTSRYDQHSDHCCLQAGTARSETFLWRLADLWSFFVWKQHQPWHQSKNSVTFGLYIVWYMLPMLSIKNGEAYHENSYQTTKFRKCVYRH